MTILRRKNLQIKSRTRGAKVIGEGGECSLLQPLVMIEPLDSSLFRGQTYVADSKRKRSNFSYHKKSSNDMKVDAISSNMSASDKVSGNIATDNLCQGKDGDNLKSTEENEKGRSLLDKPNHSNGLQKVRVRRPNKIRNSKSSERTKRGSASDTKVKAISSNIPTNDEVSPDSFADDLNMNTQDRKQEGGLKYVKTARKMYRDNDSRNGSKRLRFKEEKEDGQNLLDKPSCSSALQKVTAGRANEISNANQISSNCGYRMRKRVDNSFTNSDKNSSSVKGLRNSGVYHDKAVQGRASKDAREKRRVGSGKYTCQGKDGDNLKSTEENEKGRSLLNKPNCSNGLQKVRVRRPNKIRHSKSSERTKSGSASDTKVEAISSNILTNDEVSPDSFAADLNMNTQDRKQEGGLKYVKTARKMYRVNDSRKGSKRLRFKEEKEDGRNLLDNPSCSSALQKVIVGRANEISNANQISSNCGYRMRKRVDSSFTNTNPDVNSSVKVMRNSGAYHDKGVQGQASKDAHVKRRVGTGKHTCKFCKKKFSTIYVKRAHARGCGHRMKKRVDSSFTNPGENSSVKGMRNSGAYRGKAVQGKRPVGTGKYRCKICKKKFSTLYVKRAHSRIYAGGCGYRMKKCVGSSFPNPDENSSTKRMRSIGARKYKCKFCNKKFCTIYSKKVHARIHTGERPYTCSFCDKKFTVKCSKEIHERIHTGDRPFKCEFCSKCFTQLSTCVSHERLHTGEKPYACKYCDKMFSYLSTKDTHERSHSVEKPYPCDYCTKRFVLPSYKLAHERIHTGEKSFTCKFCNEAFTTYYRRSIHQLIHTRETR